MKKERFQERFYRDWIAASGLKSARIVDKETDMLVLTDRPVDEVFLREKISFYRSQIEEYISKNKNFLISLKPIEAKKNIRNTNKIVKDMIECSKLCNVGPMASVAGAIAEYVGKDLLKMHREVIIENGGDIFMKIDKKRRIGVYAGDSALSGNIYLELEPHRTPLGICTSSGTVGHSLSFGRSDATIILADSAILADAAATAVGNLVNSEGDLKNPINFAKSIRGVIGVLIIIGRTLSVWGDIKIAK
jgi:hypothetical protein